MRTLLTTVAFFVLSTLSLAQGPIPQAPEFWEGTWDTYSLATDDRHAIDVSIMGTANPAGRTNYDIFIDDDGDGYGVWYDGYMVAGHGVLYIGEWLEDENGEPYFLYLYGLWSVSDCCVKYTGPMPNEGGTATKRDG